MKQVLFAICLLFSASLLAYSQQDSAAYKAAQSITNPVDKTRALEDFLKSFPESKLKQRAYDGLFALYADQGNEPASLNAAAKSLESMPAENRLSPYNSYAYTLAQKGIGLDSALAWATRAEDMARKTRSLSMIQDTRAYVLFRMNRPADAEQLQRTAIKEHENDPEYVSHLALYEKANGKLQDALRTMAAALYLGGDEESKTTFLSWVNGAESEKSKQDALKESVLMGVVHSYIDTLKGEKLASARSNAASLMADLRVDLPTAHSWAESAAKSLNKGSSINDVIAFKQSVALVLSAEGKHEEALKYLQSIEDLVDPYETRYWMTLGQTYEHLGKEKPAIDAYLNGLVPRNDVQLRNAVEKAYAKEYGSAAGLDKTIDSARHASANFDPGTYGKNTTPSGKVVLAELFTGAECGPCVGADMAFDALSEYYPRTSLAILEYHVHIPGPDPLTTNASWDRYNWYAGQGTPTAVFDGRESLVGGGPKTVARNRFGVYRYAIRKFESDKPRVDLALDVKGRQNDVLVDVRIARTKLSAGVLKPMLHIALVERSVDYTGANGIARHSFVVRRLLDSADGSEVSFGKANETVTRTISLADVEKGIREFLDSPASQPSWSNRRPFNGWRARPETLNRSNLAIVAWVQDASSKEVLQAAYKDVPSALGMK